MNLRLLEILEAVSQAGTFTGAAQKLHLTQAAVSHAVAELEQQTGTALFDRLPRGVRLTQCGALLLEEAQGILSSCRELESRMSDLEKRAPVKLVSSITIASYWLPKLIKQLQVQVPGLCIHVQVVSAANALESLRKGAADLALVEGPGPQGTYYVSVPFAAYCLRAACAPDFPLPDHPLEPQEFCALPLLLREPGSAVRDTLDSVLYLTGQTARPVWTSVNSSALIEAAHAGLGVTVLPDLLLKESVEQGRLRLVELNGMRMENKLQAVYHKDKYLTRSLQSVLDLVSSFSRQASP